MERAEKLHVIGAPLEFPRNATLWIEKKVTVVSRDKMLDWKPNKML